MHSFATLTINPRLGLKKGRPQAVASNAITANTAQGGKGGDGGTGGRGIGGQAGTPNGSPGMGDPPAVNGAKGSVGEGFGGGVSVASSKDLAIASTRISGNVASTADNDVAEAVPE
jgi:hypothetical protein